jgi:RND family efflux transporter MFP subunit
MNVNCSLAAALALGQLVVSCTPSGPSRGRDRAAAPPRLVETVPVATRALERTVTATGSLAPLDHATLTMKVPGRLCEIAVDLGSAVRTGDLIAHIEPRDYELRVQQAAAALAQARAALGLPPEGTNDLLALESTSPVREARAVFDEAAGNRARVQSLAKEKIASASELDTVEASFVVASNRLVKAFEEGRGRQAALAQRRAELELARQQLADTILRAPFAGAVELRQASLGEFIATGTPIVTLVRTDPLRLRLEVPERKAPAVRAGQAVRFHADGDTNRFTARITRLSPAISDDNRMLRVEGDVPGAGMLRPGAFVRAEIITVPEDPGLTVPLSALIVFAGLEKVVTVQDGQALERTVTTGRRGSDWVEIVAGLKSGDPVVVNPGNLRTGEPVRQATASSPAPVLAATNSPAASRN